MHNNNVRRGNFGLDDDDLDLSGDTDIDVSVLSGSANNTPVSKDDLDKSNTGGDFTRTKSGGGKAKKSRRKRVSRARSPYNAQQNFRIRKEVKEVFQTIGFETDLLDAEVLEQALLAFANEQGLNEQANKLKSTLKTAG